MKRRKNNRGFTLIEVCIASAILAIALTPFVANFIQASKMNLKSRKDLNAMTLAQDFFEGASAYTATELNEILLDAVSDSTQIAKLFPTGTATGAVSGGVTDQALYEYAIANVRTTNGGHNAYDVMVRIDGRATDEAGNRVAGKYAEKDYADINKIDAYFDATYTMPREEISSAIVQLKEPGVDEAEYYGKLKRLMKVNIENTGDDANPIYEISVDRIYEVANDADKPRLGSGTATLWGTNVSRRAANELPRSLYIYFTGMQNASQANDFETIEIRNTTGKDITVFLIRTQQSSDVLAQEVYNNNYGCTVNVISKEQDAVDEDGNLTGEKEGVTYLVSNLRYNLSKEADNNFRIYEEGSTTSYVKNVVATPAEVDANPDKDYKYAGDSFYQAARAKYYYDNTGTGSLPIQMDEATYKRIVSDGYKKREDASILYKITIDIYESGTTNRIAEYTGGVVD